MGLLQDWRSQFASQQEQEHIEKVFSSMGSVQVYGLTGTAKTLIAAMHWPKERGSLVVVTRNREHKEQWERDLAFFCPDVPILPYPIVDKVHFVATAKSLEVRAAYVEALSRLSKGERVIVLATIDEAAQFAPSVVDFRKRELTLSVSEAMARLDLLQQLVDFGYERVDQVEQSGHFSVRGDIVDIYAVNEENPIRMEFFGDEIDTIRIFDRTTQRSITSLDSVTIVAFSTEDLEETDSLLSYVGEGTLILDEPIRLQEGLQNYLREKKEHEETHYRWEDWIRTRAAATVVCTNFLQQKLSYLPTKENIGVASRTLASFEKQLPLFVDELKHWTANDYAIVLVIHNEQRRIAMERMLQEEGLAGRGIQIVSGLITEGFELMDSKFVVVAEGNIFGRQKHKLRRKVQKGQEIASYTDILPGDYVVHAVHGIGKYVGLRNMESNGIHRDYLEIDYAGSDRLFVSTENLDLLQKYIGGEGVAPRLHRMGGAEWQRTKAKAQKTIDDLAEKLVALYAKRELTEGIAFLPDQPWQQEFEDAFPYEETPDQLQATAEIKASMESHHPMDRLLCGDVGFGKTEVAMRAVFKAVMSGKQVAVLVPTTILAQQHFQTFKKRFDPFGVKVDVLNRFRTAGEKKSVLTNVGTGKIDVLVGTHALLTKGIRFKDLGLLVVDEEQRFGVAQKEKWKSISTNIDILTLSATPIPRTLHMSLTGVRELSVINTPPENRVPIQTYVVEYNMDLVADAIHREIARGGQTYIVHNRVKTIEAMGEQLERAMPGLKYVIVHGQMTGTQIEAIMVDFYEGVYDVLLSTSIIENGIDLPNANTIIVFDADKMGLSQLYQMRGRVGRSNRRAYAYFMYQPNKLLTEEAEKRLQALKEFTELGSGFKLAMRDLEIRGAGSLLGGKQHGNIEAVGFATYAAMLEEAIATLQHREVKPQKAPIPAIDLGLDAYIDDAYISDSATKITLYNRLLRLSSVKEAEEFIDELIDRFGTPTQPVDYLVRQTVIREMARDLGIQSLQWRDGEVQIHWRDDSKMAQWDIGSVDQKLWKRMRILQKDHTAILIKVTDIPENRKLIMMDDIMQALALRTGGEG